MPHDRSTQENIGWDSPLEVPSSTRWSPHPDTQHCVEARSGLQPLGTVPVDLNYGLNMTTFAFGVTGFHRRHRFMCSSKWRCRTGALRDGTGSRLQQHDWAQTQRTPRPVWGVNEFDVTASWLAGHHILYVGMSDAIDFGDPELLIGPFLGAEVAPKGNRFAWQRNPAGWGANYSPEVYDVSWLNTGDPGHGLFTFTVGASWTIGGGDPS